jgi:putative heme-binding domain-containing protein
VAALSRPSLGKAARRAARSKDARVRLGALLALRRSGEARAVASLPGFLDDPDEEVRIAALIWAAEDRPLGKGQANLIDRAVARPRPSARLLRIYAAAAELLGVPLAAVARPPGDEALVASLATAPAGDEERRAQDAAVWRLAASGSAAATEALRRLALDRQRDPELRVDAVAALAMLGAVAGLGPLGNDPSEIVKKGAHRALRQQNAERVRPSDEAAWRKAVVDAPGDPRAGRRVFFHPGVGCARCHRVDGVGGVVGPDLSTIGRGMDREKLFTSIYAPSREIAPENATRIITTKDGRTFEGLLVHEPDGAVLVKVASGEPARLSSKDIASDLRSDVSLMPEGLQEALTEQDFRDLLAFLAARK